ncbi:uncharacterized protein LOC112589462 [Harpegnathos saltator]|uniref:uncharacterized protein LOC112589462 n=1 Tax=Harpegnathos saltator TaxID=610380 RepID=UPI00058B5A0D|nr:uncharacterized protein LOC112589462 [Harpegnathos saltator]
MFYDLLLLPSKLRISKRQHEIYIYIYIQKRSNTTRWFLRYQSSRVRFSRNKKFYSPNRRRDIFLQIAVTCINLEYKGRRNDLKVRASENEEIYKQIISSKAQLSTILRLKLIDRLSRHSAKEENRKARESSFQDVIWHKLRLVQIGRDSVTRFVYKDTD